MAHDSNEWVGLASRAEQRDATGDRRGAARLFRLAAGRAARAYAADAAVDYLGQALARTPDSAHCTRYDLLLSRERLHARRGDPEARRADLASLEQLAEALGDDARRAYVASRQADCRVALGDYEAGVSLARLAFRLASLADDQPGQAAARLVWGKALLRQGDYKAAGAHLAAARDLAAPGSPMEADAIRSQGLLAINRGDLTAARALMEQALHLYRTLADRRGEGTCLNNLGHIAYNAKRFTAAGRHWGEALASLEATGDRQGRAMVLVNLGAMFLDIGDYGRAGDVLDEALEVCRQLQSRYGEALALLNLGLVNHYLGNQEQALSQSRQALALAREIGSRKLEGYALVPLGHALLALGQAADAEDAYWQALALWRELDLPALEVEMRAGLARTARARQREAEALQHVEVVLAHLTTDDALEGTESPFRIYLTCYDLLEAQGDARSRPLLAKAHDLLQSRAADIVDEPLRLAYLQNVAIHRQIVALATGGESSPSPARMPAGVGA